MQPPVIGLEKLMASNLLETIGVGAFNIAQGKAECITPL